MRQTAEAAFERIAGADEVAAIMEVVAAGRARRVDPDEAATGEGAGWVMAAFVQGGPGRFNDATFGAFYTASSEATAVAETQFHFARFLRAAEEPHTLLGARLLLATLSASPVDLRGRKSERPDLYDPDPANYGKSQDWAVRQWRRGGDGVIYDSVRHAGGQCVCLFRPRLVRSCSVGARLAYEWDGTRFTDVYTLERRPPS